MSRTLKPLAEQVVVIAGATYGIGLATAHLTASRGARLVLVARDADAVHKLSAEVTADGGQAVAVAADMGHEEQVRTASRAAVEHFGHFDTGANNAGTSSYGRLPGIPTDDRFGVKALVSSGDVAPRLTDRLMEATPKPMQKEGVPPRNPDGSLHRAVGPELSVRGDYSGPVLKSSLSPAASLHPMLTLSLAVGVGLAVAARVSGTPNGRRS